MEKSLLQYDFDVQIYNIAQNITTECIDLLFLNKGANTAYIRGIPLLQNQSLPINGNVGEIISNPVNIAFDAAGTDNQLFVIRRYYLG